MIVSMTHNTGKHIAEFSLPRGYRQVTHRFLLNLFEHDEKCLVTLNGLSWEFDKKYFDEIWRFMYNTYQRQSKDNEKKILSKLLVKKKGSKVKVAN